MRYLLCIITILIAFTGTSQQLKLSMEVGMGTYELNGLKAINDEVIAYLPFNSNLVESFPPTIYYRPAISFGHNRFTFGYCHSYVSTGSRISTKDYSGEYRFDMIISAHSPSLHIDYLIERSKNIEYYLRFLCGINYSELKIDESFLLVGDSYSNDSYRFKSSNYYLEPAFYAAYPIKSFLIEGHIGYQLSVGKNALTETSSDAKLMNPNNGEPILPSWSGIRIGLGISFTFGSKF